MKIPESAASLTAEWLTAALRRWGGAGEVTVASVTAKPLIENRGFYGQLARLHIDYANQTAAAPTSLIAKFSSPVAEMRKRSVDSYEREVRFYQELAPQVELPTPTCYYADIDLASGEHILLLQDLAPLQVASRTVGCTIDQAQRATAEIAKLHVHWWGKTDNDTDDKALAWMADGDVAPDVESMRRQYDEWWPAFYAQAHEQLPADLQTASQALGSHRATIRRHIFGSSPRTLIHRDFHADNLFFGAGEKESNPQRIAVVDWQFLSRGRGVWDIGYFLSESVTTENRRQVEGEILTQYHRTLTEKGIGEYTFDQCIFDYRMALLQRHTALVSTLAAMPFSAEQRHIHLTILLPRNIAAIRDHDAFAIFQ